MNQSTNERNGHCTFTGIHEDSGFIDYYEMYMKCISSEYTTHSWILIK